MLVKMLISTLLPLLMIILCCESVPTDDKKAKSHILMISDNTWFSHFQFTVLLANELQKFGHQVFLYVEEHHGISDRNALNVKIDPDVEVELRYYDPEFKAQFVTENTKKSFTNWHQNIPNAPKWELSAYRAVSHYYELTQRKCNKDLMEKLRYTHFDLGIAERQDLGAFAELGIQNTMATSATPVMPIFMHFLGLPLPLTVPEHHSARLGDCATPNCIQDPIRQRKNEWHYRMIVSKFENVFEKIHQAYYIQKFGANKMLKMAELFKRSKLFLANAIEGASIPRPMLSKIKFIGGIAVNTELYKLKWSTSTKSDKCIILMSFGSVVSFDTVPEHILRAMIDAFGQFGQETGCQFVVKIPISQISKYYLIDYAENIEKIEQIFNSKNLFQIDPKPTDEQEQQLIPFPDNVYPIKWVEQQQFLASHEVRAFITHCGQNSLNEAICAGVPVICMPFFGDQHFNAATVEYAKLGVWVEPSKVNKTLMLSALRHLFEPRNNYHQNSHNMALKLQKEMQKLGSPNERLNNFVEQIISGKNDFDDQEILGMDKVPGASTDGKFPYLDFTQKWSATILDAKNSDEAIGIPQ